MADPEKGIEKEHGDKIVGGKIVIERLPYKKIINLL